MASSLEEDVSVASECSGEQPVNRAAAETAVPGNTSNGNSSLEPEEPGKRRAHVPGESSEKGCSELGRQEGRSEEFSPCLQRCSLLCLWFKSCTGTTSPSPAPTLLQRHRHGNRAMNEPDLWELCHQPDPCELCHQP